MSGFFQEPSFTEMLVDSSSSGFFEEPSSDPFIGYPFSAPSYESRSLLSPFDFPPSQFIGEDQFQCFGEFPPLTSVPSPGPVIPTLPTSSASSIPTSMASPILISSPIIHPPSSASSVREPTPPAVPSAPLPEIQVISATPTPAPSARPLKKHRRNRLQASKRLSPYKILQRLACSPTCEVCNKPENLIEEMKKIEMDYTRRCQPKHKYGYSVLSEWMTNAFVSGREIDEDRHYNQTVNQWLEAQKNQMSVDDLWAWIVDETGIKESDCDSERWFPVVESFTWYTTFLHCLQIAAPKTGDPEDTLERSFMLYTARHAAMAIRLIDSEEPAFLKQYLSLEKYIDMLTTASLYILAIFGYEDWVTTGMAESRIPGDPLTTWFRWFQHEYGDIKQDIKTFKEAWPFFHRRNMRKNGRYENNLPYYKPSRIVNEEGEEVVNIGTMYISVPDEEELKDLRVFHAYQEHILKHPERRAKIPKTMRRPIDMEEHERSFFHLGFANWYRQTQPMPTKGSVYVTMPMGPLEPSAPWYEYCVPPEIEPFPADPPPPTPSWQKKFNPGIVIF